MIGPLAEAVHGFVTIKGFGDDAHLWTWHAILDVEAGDSIAGLWLQLQ